MDLVGTWCPLLRLIVTTLWWLLINSISSLSVSLQQAVYILVCLFPPSLQIELSGWAGTESKEGLIGQTLKPLAEHAALWLCLLLRPVVTQGWLQLCSPLLVFDLYNSVVFSVSCTCVATCCSGCSSTRLLNAEKEQGMNKVYTIIVFFLITFYILYIYIFILSHSNWWNELYLVLFYHLQAKTCNCMLIFQTD